MTEKLQQDTKITSLYKAIIGVSDTSDLDYEIKVKFLENISTNLSSCRFLFLSKRHNVHKKQEQKNLKFKSKAPWNEANKQVCSAQIPSTFVPNCGGRIQFLFLERSSTASSLLDSCFVRIWLNPFAGFHLPLQLCMEEHHKRSINTQGAANKRRIFVINFDICFERINCLTLFAVLIF